MVGKLKDDCQKYTEYVREQVLKSYLYQWRVRPGFPRSWRWMLYLMKPKGNNTRFRIMKRFKYLLSKQNHTWMMGDGGGGVFRGFYSSSDWCSEVSWLWDESMISIQIKWSHKGFKFSYLLKKKEDWLEHLFEVLLLLKIALQHTIYSATESFCRGSLKIRRNSPSVTVWDFVVDWASLIKSINDSSKLSQIEAIRDGFWPSHSSPRPS